MSMEWESSQARLVEVLSERSGHPAGSPGRAALDAEVARLAAGLGLDPRELDELTPAQLDALREPPALQGRFRIMRRARDVMPFYVGLLLVPMVAGLGAPPVAAGLAIVLGVAAIVHHRRRLSVFQIDAFGRLDIRHAGVVGWDDVDAVSFRLRYPWLAAHRGTGLAEDVTAKVRVRRSHGRDLRLAQGQLFQVRPGRRPVSFDRLGRYLRNRAKAAGLVVERLPAPKEGWVASRRT